MKDIGARLKEARKGADMTQEDVASRLEITKGAVSQWENNNTVPELPLFVRFCEVTKCSPDYILFGRKIDHHPQEILDLAKRISTLDSKKRELLVTIFAT